MTENVTPGEAVAAVAEQGGIEAASLLVDLMDRNRRDAEWMDEQIRSGVERDRDQWRTRALEAEAQIERIESRLLGLLV